MNYFYDLPIELQQIIYEFDNTYDNRFYCLMKEIEAVGKRELIQCRNCRRYREPYNDLYECEDCFVCFRYTGKSPVVRRRINIIPYYDFIDSDDETDSESD